MVKKVSLITLIFLIIFSNCSLNENNNLIHYHEVLGYVTDSTLYNHFPNEKLIKKYSVSYSCPAGNSALRIEIFDKKSNNYLKKFITELEQKNFKKFLVKDSCLNYYPVNKDTIPSKFLECIKYNPPLPNYIFWLDPDNIMFNYDDIKEDLTYYIIEVRSGKFMPDSLLTKNKPLYAYAYNGCSRGYAISKNAGLIVYWLIIW
ncbi:MAG: hypothetical protein WBI87_06180 [Bacteroidales bacterium]